MEEISLRSAMRYGFPPETWAVKLLMRNTRRTFLNDIFRFYGRTFSDTSI